MGARADLAMYVVCDTAMIQTDPSGFIRRPTKFDRRRLNRRTLANLAPLISQNRAREMVAANRTAQVNTGAPCGDIANGVRADARLALHGCRQKGMSRQAFPQLCLVSLRRSIRHGLRTGADATQDGVKARRKGHNGSDQASRSPIRERA